MNKFKKALIVLGCAGVFALSHLSLMAEDYVGHNAPPPPPGSDRRDKPETTMQMLREQLVIRDNARWTAVSGKIRSVLDARQALASEFGARARRVSGSASASDTSFGPKLRAEEALFNAILNNAPDSSIASVMVEVQSTARAEDKAKEEAYTKAQDALRGVLNARQQAQLTLFGVLK